jgi:hypothetical protein
MHDSMNDRDFPLNDRDYHALVNDDNWVAWIWVWLTWIF